MTKIIPFFALSALDIAISDDKKLTQLTAVDGDQLTRNCYNQKTGELEFHTTELPQGDGKSEIVDYFVTELNGQKAVILLTQDVIEFDPMLDTAFHKVYTTLDALNVQQSDYSKASAAIAFTQFGLQCRILIEQDGKVVGYNMTTVRDIKRSEDGFYSLIAFDGTLVQNVSFMEIVSCIQTNEIWKLFKNGTKNFKFSTSARLLPVRHMDSQVRSVVWDPETQQQLVIGENYEIMGFANKVKGPIMGTIDNTKPGLVNAVVDGRVMRAANPSSIITGENSLVPFFGRSTPVGQEGARAK